MAMEYDKERPPKTHRLTVPIYGFRGRGEEALAVQRSLQSVPGIIRAYVNAATEMAYVKYDPLQASPDQVIDAVEGAGFQAGRPSMR